MLKTTSNTTSWVSNWNWTWQRNKENMMNTKLNSKPNTMRESWTSSTTASFSKKITISLIELLLHIIRNSMMSRRNYSNSICRKTIAGATSGSLDTLFVLLHGVRHLAFILGKCTNRS